MRDNDSNVNRRKIDKNGCFKIHDREEQAVLVSVN